MMETLVVLDEHRNEYFNRRAQGPARFGSAPSGGFRGINCRTFQSGVGILPTPLKGVTKRACASSPKTPSPSVKWHSEESKHLKKVVKSSSISIPMNINDGFNEGFFFEGFPFSELWAGPAYSNSPPPSSLPIPKFSLCSKRLSHLTCLRNRPLMWISTQWPSLHLLPPRGTVASVFLEVSLTVWLCDDDSASHSESWHCRWMKRSRGLL